MFGDNFYFSERTAWTARFPGETGGGPSARGIVVYWMREEGEWAQMEIGEGYERRLVDVGGEGSRKAPASLPSSGQAEGGRYKRRRNPRGRGEPGPYKDRKGKIKRTG